MDSVRERLEGRDAPSSLTYFMVENAKCSTFDLTINVITREIKLKNKTIVQLNRILVDLLPKLVQYERVQIRRIFKDKE